MKPKAVKHPRFLLHREKKSRGFALIATILLMVLLAIITIGTLSLSVVTIRSAAQDSALAHARANARMALMIAIGEIQKYAGPDTRVTAPSDIVDESAAHLTGVWKSWDGADHLSNGQPIAPTYDLKDQAVSNNGYFLKWLVSGANSGIAPQIGLNNLFASGNDKIVDTVPFTIIDAEGKTIKSIPLLATGSIATDDLRQIHVIPQKVNDTGSYVWWVSGENQKARLPKPYKPINENVAQLSTFAQSHSVVDPKPFGLDSLLADPAEFTPDPANPKPVDKVISRDTADFIVANATYPKPRHFFHDLSTSSVGLLTNTATGGWRKDFSTFTETWDTLVQPSDILPLFRISSLSSAGSVSQVSIPTPVAPRAVGGLLYPWGGYLGTSASSAHGQNGRVNSWHHLKEYAIFYRQNTVGADGGTTIPLTFANLPNFNLSTPAVVYDYLHKVRPMPIVARFHWLFSLKTVKIPTVDPDPTKWTYNLQVLITPVFTLWNPYNVSVSIPNLTIQLTQPPPCLIQFQKSDGTLQGYKRLIIGAPIPPTTAPTSPAALIRQPYIQYDITSTISLKPGQTTVYSASIINSSASPASSVVTMTPGLNGLNKGHLATITDATTTTTAGTPLVYKASDIIKANIKFTQDATHSASEVGKGIRLEGFVNPSPGNFVPTSKKELFYLMTYPITDADANLYWPPIPDTSLAQQQAQFLTTNFTPYFSSIFGSRLVSDSTLPRKGFLQSNPLTLHSNGSQNTGPFPGSAHPSNSSLDYSFIAHTLGDSRLPNAEALTNNGFIISGFTSGTGLSRAIMNEFPLRPISSLGQLQNWDMHSTNPRPPFALNVIGNSDATPLIANNSASRGSQQHDDSYCANHLLFDDWFASSIAPNPTSFGTAGDDIRTHYTKFLKGETSLTNRDYRPISADWKLSATDADIRAKDILDSKDGWQRVASRLEVEGMFNVNSTSVTAWRALLGHGRGQKIPYFNKTGMAASGATDHVFTRFSIAGDALASGPGMSGTFAGSTDYTGYKVFTDKMLDTLAVKIVEQVRLRGPFLSLSEFVNRQLTTSNEELALAGAIQTALNKLSGVADDDPQKELKIRSVVTNADPPGDEMYVFRKAAEGHGSYGVPGWIRQADILSPIAPILSARDDTFTIRAYGDVKDKEGKILARAWCEATVRRTRDFINPTDSSAAIDTPSDEVNITFGRRYQMISFQWLSPDEV